MILNVVEDLPDLLSEDILNFMRYPRVTELVIYKKKQILLLDEIEEASKDKK